MATIRIDDVPDETRRKLERHAASRSEPFNAYLLKLLERAAAEVTREEVVDAITAGREERDADLMRAILRKER